MKRVLIYLLVTLFSFSYAYAENNTSTIAKDIPVKTDPDDNRTNHPRKPARNPLTVLLMGDCISVTCDYEANGEVEVYDNYSGIMVASDEGELSTGLMLILSEYHEGSMEIQITLDNKIYRGSF